MAQAELQRGGGCGSAASGAVAMSR